MNNKIYAFIFPLSFCSTLAQGQQIRGTLKDTAGQPLEAATVALYRQSDERQLASVGTDTAGRFHFKNLTAGLHRLKISIIGYETLSKDSIEVRGSAITELPLVLNSAQGKFDEILVTAKRPYIEKRLDRTVINPDALLSNAGGTALEALEKSPGVQLEQNGNIRLSGKSGVSVYIDDRPTYLTGEELREYLRALPIAQIDRIELMTNPPANYDVVGSGGIIVIHTKRYRSKGMHGGASLAYQQGRYGQTVNSADFGLNRQKWALATSFSLTTTNTYTDLDIFRRFDSGTTTMSPIFSQDTWIKRKGKSFGGKIGTDYFMSNNSTLGININLRSSPLVLTSYGESRFMSSSNMQDSSLRANNREDRRFSNLGTNINYRYKRPDSEQKLTIDLDYLIYNGNNEQHFNNTTYQTNGVATVFEALVGKVPNKMRIYAAKTDYVHPLKKGLRISSGLKSSRTNTDNRADFFKVVDDKMISDLEKTNHFRFRESIHAAYLNMDGNSGQWNYQAGLRFEGTISQGHQLGNEAKPDSSFKRRHMDFFPTVFLQYKPSTESKHAASFNYGRRIDRPHYSWLNPFITPFDKYTYYTGTPYLRPSYIHQAELSYSFQPLFDMTLAYGRVSDLMSETIRIVNGVYYSQQGNLGSLTTKSATFNISYEPLAKLSVNCHAAIHSVHTKSELFGQQMDTKGTFILIRPTFTYKVSSKWIVQLDGEYQGSQKFAQFTVKERARANTAVNFKMNSTCSINLAINDLLHSDTNAGEIGYLADTYATYATVRDTRTVNLSFRYRFTKGAKNDRSYQGGGAQSEQQRT